MWRGFRSTGFIGDPESDLSGLSLGPASPGAPGGTQGKGEGETWPEARAGGGRGEGRGEFKGRLVKSNGGGKPHFICHRTISWLHIAFPFP